MSDWRQDRIGSALRGENPTVLARLPGAFAVIGDVQWLPGYSVLISDDPSATRLSDLSHATELDFLASAARLARAVEAACAEQDPGFRRINLEILGNADDFLHAHVWPRYDWEPAELVTRPVWLYPLERWSDPNSLLSEAHAPWRQRIAELLNAPAT